MTGEEPKHEGTTEESSAPGRRVLALASLGMPLALLDAGTGLGLAAAATFDGLLGVGSWLEIRALRGRRPAITRRVGERLVVGRENPVEIQVHNPTGSALRLRVRDTMPPEFEVSEPELMLDVPAHARRTATYTVVPTRRGRFMTGDIHAHVEGALGLGAHRFALPARRELRVYPDVMGLRGEDVGMPMSDIRATGFRATRRLGGGGEFAQLREYVAGDPFRDLDWKSTAKRRRPVTRVFEQERSQNILLCLDVGRMMAARMDGPNGSNGSVGPTKLDQAIRAALLLAWVALRNGDCVGVVLFGSEIVRFVPPRRGRPHYARLLEALYATEPEPTFVDFRALVAFVRARVPRRALVMIFSDLLDDSHAMPLAEHAAVLRHRHLPVCVTLEEPVATRLADRALSSHSDAEIRGEDSSLGDSHPSAAVYARAAAADLLADRERVKIHLEKSGVSLVEAPASELAVATIRRYLEIKARQIL